jgi:uncharacterized Tic20 family protein
MFRDNKQLRGLMISVIGMLFTMIGMVLLAIKSATASYLSFTLLGALFATVGVVVLIRDNMKK